MEIADKIFRLVCSKSHQCIALNLDILPHKRRVARARGKLIRAKQKVCGKNPGPILIPGKTGHCIVLNLLFIVPTHDTSWGSSCIQSDSEALRHCKRVSGCKRVNLTFRIKTNAVSDALPAQSFLPFIQISRNVSPGLRFNNPGEMK